MNEQSLLVCTAQVVTMKGLSYSLCKNRVQAKYNQVKPSIAKAPSIYLVTN